MKKYLLAALCISFTIATNAQPERWQQKVNYTIDASLNVQTNIITGKENIIYWNNSPDTLHRIFIFLYWNAFQPGSMMDVRSRELGKKILGYTRTGKQVRDWDSRVRDRIENLKPGEIGYQHVNNVLVNGLKTSLTQHETVLEVDLSKPILPHSQNTVSLPFEAQVPVQIRRSGRDNAEGVRYSMSQWYPKIAEYDYEGWNVNPYIAREFYGVWGDFDVNITTDKHYMLAGTGTIQNPDEVGFGYGKVQGVPQKPSATTTWHFAAHNVHDFVWAADTGYILLKRQIPTGPLFYFVYKKKDAAQDSLWNKTADSVAYAYKNFIAKTFGAYPYKNYSFIQGGDGGMEYPMATLIKSGSRGTALHEFGHSWYQGVLGSNESLFPWMDEGGATYFETRTTGWLHRDSLWYLKSLKGYFNLVKSRLEEPMSTHADHYNTNYAYEEAAYSKGATFYEQLSYIIGNANMDKFLLAYFNIWKFKHPNANDLIRVAEKVSGLELEWYKQYWIYSTKTIDYGINSVSSKDNHAVVTLQRIGLMPMPLDVLVTYKDGSYEMYNIPCNMMYGHKPAENNYYKWIFAPEWFWTSPTYDLELSKPLNEVQSVEIDHSQRMADVDRTNNVWKVQ
ncbi:peptidase M1 [Arachidicoccus ginsenosidimutans]|uniref:M1 family metallopeptidase n=1 Tax=Arachidicoccus sp. BS20 TaxID=1850526 RepID=UPI0007F04EEC|nr:M1 family metallopeptidase [Arachidicoccus sp. BS20]ANI89160.1 peptidase M1 [Arachidicoccus sp. BS20]